MLKKLTPSEIALDLADKLEREETFYSQSDWEVCGSPSCIAGHVVHDHGDFERAVKIWRGSVIMPDGSVTRYGTTEDHEHHGFQPQAQRIMGLTDEQAFEMFRACPMVSLPDGYTYNEYPTKQEAAAMLRHFAETGEVVWRFVR